MLAAVLFSIAAAINLGRRDDRSDVWDAIHAAEQRNYGTADMHEGLDFDAIDKADVAIRTDTDTDTDANADEDLDLEASTDEEDAEYERAKAEEDAEDSKHADAAMKELEELDRDEAEVAASKFNAQLQTLAQLDTGKLRISPVGDLLGHPSAADRQQCLDNAPITMGGSYTFNCAHRGDGDSADSLTEGNVIDNQEECENSYTIRHRMDDEKFGRNADGTPAASPYEEECSLRGEVQFCAWEKDSVACPGGQGGRDCSSAGKCSPSGQSDFVCALDKPILVDCKSNTGLTNDQVKAGNGFGDDWAYGNPATGVDHGTNPERTDVHGTPN